MQVNGPASDGLIRGVRGDPHDDNVALNAWEWKNYAPSYSAIERIDIEDVTGAPDGANSIRLLPGVKRFDDGATLVVMHRRIPGRKAAGAGKPDPTMSYGIMLRSGRRQNVVRTLRPARLHEAGAD